MNFGDILDKWDRVQSRNSSHNTMETWLRDNDVYDKDAGEGKIPAQNILRRRMLRNRPDDILDIHGLTGEQAWHSLKNFFLMAKDNGYKKLRIIHGKGNHSKGEAILGRTVRRFIEQCPFAGESGHEKAVNGGTGATWVLLK